MISHSFSSLRLMLLMLAAGCIFSSGCSQQQIGITEGRLYPCPQLPNCEASVIAPYDSDSGSGMQPFSYTGSTARARQALIWVIKSMEGSRIVEARDNYIHSEFRSSVFGFVDDVEFLFPEKPRVIHFRSASRRGFYDFNVNKKRIEEIRSLFNAKMAGMMTREITEPD